MDIITPQRLYHGTTDRYIGSFRKRLLDSGYWRPGRDFGEGFYATISAGQARKWAHLAGEKGLEPVRPCVLEVELIAIPADVRPLVFLSESPGWAEFIFDHRKEIRKGIDPCSSHPDLIIGPMADNDTGKIVLKAVQLEKDAEWFYERITRSVKGRKLDSLRLGNQVVFSSERWESSLCLVGYYIFAGGRWGYHANSNSVESI